MIRKRARELLADSFRKRAQSTNADRITVQDIAANCGYSPATFYRNFRDKYDLIAWEYARGTAAIINRMEEKSDYSWRQTLLDSALRFQSERAYLANLFLHTSGHDSFVLYMTDINFETVKNCI